MSGSWTDKIDDDPAHMSWIFELKRASPSTARARLFILTLSVEFEAAEKYIYIEIRWNKALALYYSYLK